MVEKLIKERDRLGRYYYLFMIMYLNGTRISETLNLKKENITSTGQVLMIADKGSRDRLLNTSGCELFLLESKADGVDPFFRMDRFQAYRFAKRLGISILKKGRKNESVTHSFRNEYAKRLRNIGLNGDKLGNITGHKVAKNTDYYGKD